MKGISAQAHGAEPYVAILGGVRDDSGQLSRRTFRCVAGEESRIHVRESRFANPEGLAHNGSNARGQLKPIRSPRKLFEFLSC
jgi:hypothetical protein